MSHARILLMLMLLSLGLRVAYIALRYDVVQVSHGGDYALYEDIARQFEQHGNVSIRGSLFRPPLFPIMIYVLDFNRDAVLAVNTLFGALIVPITYVLALQLKLAQRLAILAAVIVAIDPASIIHSAFLIAEPLSDFLLVLVVVLLFKIIQQDRYAVGYATLAGIMLALSALARPTIYLLWIPLGGWLLLAYPRQWLAIATFAAVSLAGLAPWYIHNGVVFDHYTYSTVGNYNLLYIRAASVENLATDKSIQEVYIDLAQRVDERIGRDTNREYPPHPYDYISPTKEESAAYRDIAFEIFAEHPQWYVATIPLGVARMFGWSNDITGIWRIAETTWNFALLGLAVIGLGLAFRHKNWLVFWSMGLICAYYTAGTLYVKTSSMDTRMRSMLIPFMAILVAYAWDKAMTKWGNSPHPLPPLPQGEGK